MSAWIAVRRSRFERRQFRESAIDGLYVRARTPCGYSREVAASGFAALYYISQSSAILYPGTAFFDPQFITPHSYPLGIALQIYLDVFYYLLVALASWLALRRGARWTG